MAKGVYRLPASFHKLKPGTHCDGNNLYLEISLGPRGNRRLSWVFRYTMPGRRVREMGLGGTSWVSLGEARDLARKYKAMTRQGIDPIGFRDAAVAKNLAASATVMTFDQCAEIYIRQHRAAWSNPVHAAEWPSSLRRYASPIIGSMSIASIETAHISKILDPIWTTKTQTAKRLRGRIEAVIGWATVKGFRQGDNPARWSGHLQNALPAPGKVSKVKPIASLPYADLPAFMAELRKHDDVAALALQLLALSCVRASDIIDARWADIDVGKRIWTIPSFSKVHREHRVPLSTAAVAVIEKVRQHGAGGELLFARDGGGRLYKNMLGRLLARMGRTDFTPHGFRSTFRTWAQERTNYPREICEAVLGHSIGSAVEKSYARSDFYEKRARIMEEWGRFCLRPTTPADVVPLHGRRRVRS